MNLNYPFCLKCGPLQELTEPKGYVEWEKWAEEKSKTHSQVQCKICKFYTLWNPK